MVDLELGVLQPVQQQVHARQVVGGDVLLLPEDHADALGSQLMAHVQQQGGGATGDVQDAAQALLLAVGGLLAVQGDNPRQDGRAGWRGIELPAFLPEPAANWPIRYS